MSVPDGTPSGASSPDHVVWKLGPVSKRWWRSRTIWAAILILVTQAARVFTSSDPYELLTDADFVSTVIGAMGVLFGRTKASTPIRWVP